MQWKIQLGTQLVAIGVLTKINLKEWAASRFIILKKDGQVRFIYNFKRLNKQIKRTPYPLPHFKDMLNKLSNFTYDKALYLIMGYYNISLTDTVSFGNRCNGKSNLVPRPVDIHQLPEF